MKSILFTIFLGFLYLTVFSQENPNSNAIQTAIKVKALQEKKAEYHRLTNGELDGYRVKIHFSADRTKAREIKKEFETKYNQIPAYEDYIQPNFVIMIGDYKTKLEAFEVLKKIKVDYPFAFIVKSKIKPMKLG